MILVRVEINEEATPEETAAAIEELLRGSTCVTEVQSVEVVG